MSIKANRVAVAVHTYGHINPKAYSNHISVFSDWSKNFNIVFMSLDGAKVAEARNILVEKAIEMECTHILFVDSDHIIDRNMLPYLLGNDDAVAVSGLVTKRSGEGPQVGFMKADEDFSYTTQLPVDGISYSVDACAFGCTLIDLDVFNDIEKPYFKDVTLRNREGSLYSRRSDMHFCRELRDAGKTIRIDTRVIVGHIGDCQVFYPENKEFQLETYKTAASILEDTNRDSVIDLGCGFGSKLIKYIKPHCSNITGVDVLEVVEFAKTRDKGISWISIDLNKPFELAKHDVIICADVLEHINNIDGLMTTIKSGMDENSIVVMSTPNSDTVGEDVKSNSGHVNFWNVSEFENILDVFGFKIIKFKKFDEIINYESMIAVCMLKGE